MIQRSSLSVLSLMIALLVSSTARAQSAASDPNAALPADARALLEAITSERTPDPSEHYWVSNEWRHDLYFESIRDLGGAFVGVGTDQCYTLAAVQNASLLFIVDYDPMVPLVHSMYGVLIGASDTPAAFLAHFAPEASEETSELLRQALGESAEAREVVRLYRRNRGRFQGYLAHVAALVREGQPASWLADAALYARIRNLFARGRVIARSGDVTGATTMRSVAAASATLQVPMRVVYLSNAEAFFPYSSGFTANMRALPTDARSVVLRTFRHARATYPQDDTWHYLVHPMPDFLERLGLGYRRMLHIAVDAIRGGLDPRGVTAITSATPRLRAARSTP